MKRLLCYGAAGISLLLFLMLLALEIRSHRYLDVWRYIRRDGVILHLQTGLGRVRLGVMWATMIPEREMGRWDHGATPDPQRRLATFGTGTGRFHLESDTRPSGYTLPDQYQGPHWITHLGMDPKSRSDWRGCMFPIWLPMLLTAVAPAWAGSLVIRNRRRRALGRCSTCGYDLRATPSLGRCPECGTPRSGSDESEAV